MKTKTKYWTFTGEKVDKKGYVKIPVELFNILILGVYLNAIFYILTIINNLIN